MHRHHALGRQQIVEHTEDRLLGFAGIFGPADQHDAALQIDSNHGLRPAAVARRIGTETRQIDDGEIRRKVSELAFCRRQQVADEQRVPSEFQIDACADAIVGIGPSIEILRQQILAFGMRLEVFQQRVKMRFAHRLIVVPPDSVFGFGIPHRVFVGC